MIYSIQFKKHARMLTIGLFITYLMLLAYLLFLSPSYGRTLDVPREYNLLPLKTIKNYIKYREYVTTRILYTNILGNIIAFVPMGLFVPFVFKNKRSILKVVFVSTLVSFIVELLQFKFAVGSFDVDDIILNTLGGAVGFILYRLLYRFYYILYNRKQRNDDKKTIKK